MLDHLVRHQLRLWGNPRNSWCYGDESYVGALKALAAASHHPATLEQVVMGKMTICAGVHAQLAVL